MRALVRQRKVSNDTTSKDQRQASIATLLTARSSYNTTATRPCSSLPLLGVSDLTSLEDRPSEPLVEPSDGDGSKDSH